MKRIKWDKRVSFLLMMSILLTGCFEGKRVETKMDEKVEAKEKRTEVVRVEKRLLLRIQETEIEILLENNATSDALLDKLPMKVLMSDLNRNEKYIYLDESLPSNPKQVKQVKAGELMLFGSDCLVLFYEGHRSSYNYTKIGEVIEEIDIKNFLGKEDVEVNFILAD